MTTGLAPRPTSLLSSRGRGVLLNVAPFAGIIVVLLAAAAITPDFYSRAGLTLVLFQVGFIGVTAVGQTLVMLTGGIDLSIGGVIGLTTVIVATQSGGSDSHLASAIGLAVLGGLVIGAGNAALVLFRQVPPFVATFATFVLVQGFITAWTRGAPSGAIPGALQGLGAGRFLGAPVPMWLFVVIAAATAVVLARTSAGRRLYASGANRRATQLSGVRTGWIIATTYLLSALLAVLAGLIDAGYVGHVDAQLSRNLNLDSIAAAVIGGVALTGGRGNMAQTLVGVVLLSVLVVWMIQLGAGAGGQLVVEGTVILLAAWLQGRGQGTRFSAPKGGR